jgi:hypothetical protein
MEASMRYNAATSPKKTFSKEKEVPVDRKWISRASDYIDASSLPDPFAFSKEWSVNLCIEDQLAELVHYGCAPNICRRGDKWRFHINVHTSIWADGSTIGSALRKVLKLWEDNRRPTKDERGVEMWVQEQKRGADTRYVKVWRVL